MRECSRICGHAVNRASVRVEPDTTIAKCGGGLALRDRAHQDIDALTRQGAGKVVRLDAGGIPLHLALWVLTGQVAFIYSLAATTRLIEHGIEQPCARHKAARGRAA